MYNHYPLQSVISRLSVVEARRLIIAGTHSKSFWKRDLSFVSIVGLDDLLDYKQSCTGIEMAIVVPNYLCIWCVA